MAAADPMFESLQRLQSMMESFDESLSQLCKDNSSESALELWKNLMEYYHDLQKTLHSRYETLEIEEKKAEEPATREKIEENETSKVNGLNPASSSVGKVLSSVEVRSEIKILCDEADGRGLRNYIVDNMNEGETLRNELLVALGKAPDAAKLVIEALEDCDLSKGGSSKRKKGEPLSSVDGKACNLLLESLYPVFGNDDSDFVPSDVKDSARKIAKVWRMKILGRSEKIQKNVYSASKFDVQLFLQLLATFRLAADYKKNGLWGLARAILRRKGTPELCRSLGLSSKIPTLHIKSNPDMALRYAHVCGVMDKIDPVDLLTSSLRRDEEAAKELLTKGHGSADSQNIAYTKMVGALERVIGLIKKYGLQSHFCEDDLQNKLQILLQEREALKKKGKLDAKRRAQEEKDRDKDAEEKAQEEKDRDKDAEEKAQEEEDGKKAAEKKEQEEEDRKKAAEKKAQEEEDRKKATEQKAQEEIGKKKAAEKKAQEEDRKKAAEKKAQEKEDREKATEKKAQVEKDRKKAAEKKAKETEDRKKATEKRLQHKRRQSSELGYGPSERENYASKRAKHASPNMTTRVAGGMGNTKASPYNIDRVQKKSGIIGHDHHTSPFSPADRSSTGPAAGAFTSAPSTAAQINDERRRLPSAFGTSNLTPIGSSFYGSSIPAGAFAVPLYNVAEINYEGRGQRSHTMNLGEVDKNHVRASVYETGDLAKSSATQSNYNYEGRGRQSYKLNFVEVDNNPVSTSAYATGVLANSSATQAHYERRGQELYTSAFGGGSNTGSIGSSVYGSNSRTIPSSDVNQRGKERSLGQYSGFASRNMVPIESSGYGPDVSTVPPSNVTQVPFESRCVIDKYRFNSGSSL